MPYDATIEIDEFRFMDTRDRPERDYRPEQDLPPRRRPQYSGPTARQIEQERQRLEQMAAYLATNPDPITGLPRNPLADIVNNPAVTVTPAEVKAINDPKKMMTQSGKIVSGRDVIRTSGQFRSTGIPLPRKRTRRKTKMDKTMSICLKEANARYRKKNGQLKKGKTMSDVMRLAHRLCKKSGTKKGQVRKTARRAYEPRR